MTCECASSAILGATPPYRASKSAFIGPTVKVKKKIYSLHCHKKIKKVILLLIGISTYLRRHNLTQNFAIASHLTFTQICLFFLLKDRFPLKHKEHS